MKKILVLMAIGFLCFSSFLCFSIFTPQARAQLNWVKHSNNPVLGLGPNGSWDSLSVWDPTVLYNGTTYRMYYDGTPASAQYIKIGLATSTDGMTWTKYANNPILSTGPSGSWDNLQVSDPCVIFNGSKYLMYYSGNDGGTMRIGLATSTDGIVWTKYSNNPLFSATSWEGEWVVGPSVVFNGSTYKMWYTGYDGTHQRIGYATSQDGVTWTKHTTPVLDIGNAGEWDSLYVNHCSVVYSESTYQMWYGGGSSTGVARSKIGHATSIDGINWQKDPHNPVIGLGSSGSWDYWSADQPTVIAVGSTLNMWYSGHDGTNVVSSPTYYERIGMATLSQITLTPSAGFASTTVIGSGFSSDSKITIAWDGTTIPSVPSTVTTDATGNFAAIVSVLTQTAPGTHIINATDESGNWATATFTVVNMTGPQGPNGQTGLQGPRGYNGTQGPQGSSGETQLVLIALPTAVSIVALCIAVVALLRRKP